MAEISLGECCGHTQTEFVLRGEKKRANERSHTQQAKRAELIMMGKLRNHPLYQHTPDEKNHIAKLTLIH